MKNVLQSFAACLLALIALRVWDACGWIAAITLGVSLGLVVLVLFAKHLRDGRKGLKQWPSPHGRYYKEWLSAQDADDYYEWLADRMGNREPWASWAVLHRRTKRFSESGG
jgi:hypothetical protein